MMEGRNMKILISSLGTGMYKDNKGYSKTTYRFDDGAEVENSIFLKALLQHDSSIEKIIIVGTRTSSWDIFIEKDEALWLRIREACETPSGISDEQFAEIRQALNDAFPKVEVVLKIHGAKLDADTAEDILDVYNSIPDEIRCGDEVIFDIRMASVPCRC
jgi:hypothetical protein